MILAHIFLPAMLIVICKSQQTSMHFPSAYGSEETPNYYSSSSMGDTLASPALSSVEANDELLDRYRKLIAKSLLKLYDSCKVHDFLQNIKHNMENDIDDDSSKSAANMEQHTHQQRYISALLRLLEKQRDDDVTLFLPIIGSNIDDTPKSALFYYVSISLLLQDKELDETLNYLLHEKCCKNDINYFGTSICAGTAATAADSVGDPIADKRNTIKKVKFHSWGGKRSDGSTQNNVRTPANVDLSKDLGGQSKIVIRTPFRPWGGKRTVVESNS